MEFDRLMEILRASIVEHEISIERTIASERLLPTLAEQIAHKKLLSLLEITEEEYVAIMGRTYKWEE